MIVNFELFEKKWDREWRESTFWLSPLSLSLSQFLFALLSLSLSTRRLQKEKNWKRKNERSTKHECTYSTFSLSSSHSLLPSLSPFLSLLSFRSSVLSLPLSPFFLRGPKSNLSLPLFPFLNYPQLYNARTLVLSFLHSFCFLSSLLHSLSSLSLSLFSLVLFAE